MRTLLIILAVYFLASCASSKLPAAPEISNEIYYDSTYLKLIQEHKRLKEERKIYRRTASKKELRIFHITLFAGATLAVWYVSTHED